MDVFYLFFIYFKQDLHQLGARNIAILSLPPLGCLPSQRTLAGGLLRDCVPLYNQAAQEYNTLLIKEIKSLSNKFSGSKIIYVDIYNKLLDIIERPKHYGNSLTYFIIMHIGYVSISFSILIG